MSANILFNSHNVFQKSTIFFSSFSTALERVVNVVNSALSSQCLNFSRGVVTTGLDRLSNHITSETHLGFVDITVTVKMLYPAIYTCVKITKSPEK